MKLAISYTLDDCLHGIANHRTQEAWAIIAQGLWLLKAYAYHVIPTAQRGQGRKSGATPGPDSGNAGFEEWLSGKITGAESPLRMSRASAYNYMAAARALGLTAEDDERKLEELKAANALEGKRLTDLYKLEAAGPKEKGPVNHTAPGTPRDAWDSMREELLKHFAEESSPRKALYQVEREYIDGLETDLRTALDVVRSVKAERFSKRSA